jgi:hypothetical protein
MVIVRVVFSLGSVVNRCITFHLVGMLTLGAFEEGNPRAKGQTIGGGGGDAIYEYSGYDADATSP